MATVNVGSLPANVSLTLYQGDDFFLDVTVTDPVTGDPIDLADYEPRSQIRPSPSSDEVLAEFATEVDGNIIGLHLPAVESAKLALTKAAWDVQIVDAATAVVITLAYGSVLITREVTR